MKTYTIAVDAYPLSFPDIVVMADSQKMAYKQAWDSLGPEKRDQVITLDIVEVE
jgi:hypothetical protein